MNRLLSLILFSLFLLNGSQTAMSSHLMGGEATYRFLGMVGPDYQYEVKFSVYVDWDASANPFYQNNGGFISNLVFGVYDKNTFAKIGPNINIPNTDTTKYIPYLPPGCNVPGITSLKITVNTFIGTVILPGPFSEYSFLFQDCCRNSSSVNIVNPTSTGVAMMNIMAPNFLQNSSPQFLDPAIPFLCEGDTTTFSNNAVDPDGDFLVYKFIPNKRSIGGGTPPTFDPNSLPNTQYPFGYSEFQPFGPGGYAFINGTNGLTRYYAPNQGEFTITIEIEEYRDVNGNGIQALIGTTRRELQFIVRPCAPNNAPVSAPIVVNGVTKPIVNGTVNIDINEGDVLNFNISVNDANNDSLEIFMEGDIIDGTNGYTGPLATFPPAAGNGSASSTFNWSPTCGITGQYLVIMTMSDYGCPPKSNLVFFNINVREFKAASQLFVTTVGENADSVCFDGLPRSYFTTKNPQALKQWQAMGGTITGSSTSNTVTVTWNSVGTHTLQLIETSVLGCADTAQFDVVVVGLDTIVAGSDTLICPETSVQIFASGSSVGYQWSPSSFLNNAMLQNPVSSPTGTITYTVKSRGGLGCSTVDTITVEVSTTTISAGNPIGVCHNDTIQLGGIPATGVEYSWNPGDFLNDSTEPNPFLIGVNTGFAPIVKKYLLFGLDTNSTCLLADSVNVTIYPLPIANAGNNDTLCSNASTTIGTVSSPTQTCVWSNTQFLANPNACITTVTPFTSLLVNESFVYTYEVTDGPLGCKNYDSVVIVAKPLPRVFAGRDTTICSDQLLQLGDSGEAGNSYFWVTTSPNPVIPSNGPLAQQFFQFAGPGAFINHQSIVTALNTNPNNLCINADTILVRVNRLPNIVVIPDTSLCSQETIQTGGAALAGHSYTWNTSFGLSDSTIANPSLSINNPTDSSWFFTYQVVVIRNSTGCIDSASYNAEIRPLPVSDAGADIAICSDFSGAIGAPLTNNYTYSWSPAMGLSGTNISNPSVLLSTGLYPDSMSYIVLTELDACFSQDTVQVRVNPLPFVDTIFGGISICPDLQNVEYYIIDTLGFINYQWFAVGGVVENPSNNDSVRVDWGPLNPNAGLFMIPTNKYNCSRDTVSIDIQINNILSSPPPVGDTSLCLGTAQNLIYAVPYTTGYTYTWSTPTLNHTQLPIGNGSQVLYTFLEAGIAQIFVEQTVTTPTSTCLGFSDTLLVNIHPDPLDTIPILGPNSLCEFSQAAAYQIIGFPNSTYSWSLSGGGSLTADTSNAATVDWGAAGTYTLSVFETSQFNCTSGSVQLPVTINPLPHPQWVAYDSTICLGTEQGNSYQASGYANSKYVWVPQGGVLESNDSLDQQSITWDLNQVPLVLTLAEITEFGCQNNPISLTLQVDTSHAVMVNVSLVNQEDTFSNAQLRFNKGSTTTIADTLMINRRVLGSNDPWLRLGEVPNNLLSFIDTFNANRIDHIYEYNISTINLCQLPTSSLSHNTLQLIGEGVEEEDRLELTWNDYQNWPNGVQEYQIYRKLDTQENYSLYQTTSSLNYSDISANDAFDHWFYVIAVESGGTNTSVSNAFLVEFENLPFIANIITPNSDGKNDTWLIDNRELYGVVSVQVVDRYGNILYESDNYQNDWDGDQLNPGTYFYVVNIEKLNITSQGPLMIMK